MFAGSSCVSGWIDVRVWLWSVLALAGAGAASLVVWGPERGSAAASAYQTVRLDRGAITASVRATGTLNPVTTVLVGSQLSGQVVEILADYNSPVQAGQVMARLYSEQIKSRRDAARADVEQGRADLQMRRAQADKARALLQRAEATTLDLAAQRDRARAQLVEAERNLDRQSKLNERAVNSQFSLDQAQTQVDVQKAALASAEAQIASNHAEIAGLTADIALAEAQLKSGEALVLQREAKLRDIEIDLARTEIRSPVDGVVVKRDIELGQTVAASLSAPTLFTVAQDLREIDIYANIDEADVGRIAAGQPVTFTVNAHPDRTFAGTVRMVRLSAQTVQNVVTYTAVIGVENRDMALLPGMTANLQIVTDERQDAIRVPNAALRFRPVAGVAAVEPQGDAPGRSARRRDAEGDRRAAAPPEGGTRGRIYVLDREGRVREVALSLGSTDGSYTEVLGGAAEGMTVITGGGPRPSGAAGQDGNGAPRPRGPRLF
jgi:HlyD family secretion protein